MATDLRTKPVEQLTSYDIEAMSSVVYGERLKSDPGFAEKVNEIEAKRPARPSRLG